MAVVALGWPPIQTPLPETMTLSSNPSDWLDLYGDALYRYAVFRVHDEQLAEDLVQETLLAALQARERYTGNASEQTWLISILKHKIIDLFRRSSREILEDVEDEMIHQNMEGCFDEQGHWQIEIGRWSRPETALEQEQFWGVLSECVERMPTRLARLFVLREIEGMDSKEILEIMQISTTNNLWAMLSRMRLQLRNCLDIRWFNELRK